MLLDVQLPDFDGFEVASRLTKDDNPPAIVLISSRDGSDFGHLVHDSGARGFIPKAELSGERSLRSVSAPRNHACSARHRTAPESPSQSPGCRPSRCECGLVAWC